MPINVVGFDIAKQVFQVHAADISGQPVAQVRLRRAQVLDYFRSLPPSLVGMEACATAHHWARELMALGHDVRLMPPGYVKPYVKRNKTDAADAAAIAEAVTRPTMRFVPVKSAENQAMLMLHRTRELLVRQRTMLANAVRAPGRVRDYRASGHSPPREARNARSRSGGSAPGTRSPDADRQRAGEHLAAH
jgi:transposase